MSVAGRRQPAYMEPFGDLPLDARDLSDEAIEARFRNARRAGRPNYVWPAVPIAAWRASLNAIERAVAAVLADGSEGAVRLENAGRPGTEALEAAAYTSGMGPLLGYWIRTGHVESDPESARVLRFHLEHGRRRAERLGRELERTLDVLASAGIRATVIKGAHTAREYFPEPGTRPAADIDLVVGAEDISRAERVLGEAHYTLEARQPRPYQSEWIPPGAPDRLRSLDVVHADDPYTIDLHAGLNRDYFGVRSVRFDIGNGKATRQWPDLHPTASVLRVPVLTAYLASHASEGLHGLTLIRLVELVLVVRTGLASGRLDWGELHSVLRRAGGFRFAYPAFELAERLAPGTMQPDFLAALTAEATPRMRRIIGLLSPSQVQRFDRLSLAERFMWAKGPIEHLRRALYMAWPARVGGSLRGVARIYAERLFRLVRGGVTWSRARDAGSRATEGPKPTRGPYGS